MEILELQIPMNKMKNVIENMNKIHQVEENL